MKKKDELIASLLMNTGRKLRPFNLLQIADDISELSKIVGGLREVSKIIGKSEDILKQFLIVYKLPKNIKKLVKDRTLDKLQTIRYLNQFNINDQKHIVREVVKSNLNTQDLKVLAPLRKKNKTMPITKMIEQLKASKDKKVYLFHFNADSDEKAARIYNIIVKIIGKESVIEFKFSKGICVMTLNEIGLRKFRNLAKDTKKTLNKYFFDLLSKIT